MSVVGSTWTKKTSNPAARCFSCTQWRLGLISSSSMLGQFLTSRYQYPHIHQVPILHCYHLHDHFNPLLSISSLMQYLSQYQYHCLCFNHFPSSLQAPSPSCLGCWRMRCGEVVSHRWPILDWQCVPKTGVGHPVQVLTQENVCSEVCIVPYWYFVLHNVQCDEMHWMSAFSKNKLMTPGSKMFVCSTRPLTSWE